MNRQNIVKSIGKSFPTARYNAIRFGVNQILMAIILSSISGISRICKIATFSGDGLVKALLKMNYPSASSGVSSGITFYSSQTAGN